MLYSTRFRTRSTYNYSAVGNLEIGRERTEYPRGVIIDEQSHFLWSDCVSGDQEWCFDEVHRRPFNGSNGGPLLLQKVGRYPSVTGVRINCAPFGVFSEYVGNLYSVAPLRGGVSLAQPPKSYGNVESMGPEAWARFKPGKPAMQLGVFLAELKDMPRMVRDLKEKCQILKNWRGRSSWRKFISSKDFLSYQMAWKPFVSDIHKMCQETFQWRKRLDRLQANAGVWKTVGGSLQDGIPEYSDYETSTFWGGVFPILSTWYYAQPSECTLRVARSQRIWFRGKMKYFMAPINTRAGEFNALRRLYGISLTPDLVWNIMPWSWLVDWFTNTGDVISNFTTGAVDDLVAAWAYVMGHTVTESQQALRIYPKCDGAVKPLTLNARVSVECKNRGAATPFGFGLDAGDLTLRQFAILSALGIKLR